MDQLFRFVLSKVNQVNGFNRKRSIVQGYHDSWFESAHNIAFDAPEVRFLLYVRTFW